MKDLELRLVGELVKNSRVTDRELARSLDVSQPTVWRTRQRLENNGSIEYTGTPNLAKLGYEIIAVVFGKRDFAKHPETIIAEARVFVEQHPNVIFAADGNGMDYDVISISIHKDYTDYSKFMGELRAQAGETMKTDSFLVELTGEGVIRGLSLKPLGQQLIKERDGEAGRNL